MSGPEKPFQGPNGVWYSPDWKWVWTAAGWRPSTADEYLAAAAPYTQSLLNHFFDDWRKFDGDSPPSWSPPFRSGASLLGHRLNEAKEEIDLLSSNVAEGLPLHLLIGRVNLVREAVELCAETARHISTLADTLDDALSTWEQADRGDDEDTDTPPPPPPPPRQPA